MGAESKDGAGDSCLRRLAPLVRRRPGYSLSVARLQSRLRFPRQASLSHKTGGQKRNKGNDGNVASRTGPGDRSVNGLAERPPRDRRVVPVPGFGGSPVGEYRLWCFGLLSAEAEMCADTYRSLSQASRARPGPMQARPRHEKPPVRKRGEASFPETKATSLDQQRVASLARGCRCVLEA